MKIQSTTTSTKISNKKTSQSKPSGAFGEILSSQTASENTVQPTQQQSSQTKDSQQSQINISKSLDQLEDAILKLDDSVENHQLAQGAINDLRLALQHTPPQANLSENDLRNADTLLAVEAKRLEKLNK